MVKDEPFTEMYKPDAKVVKASELSADGLSVASEDPNTKVVHEHTFSDGKKMTYTTIDGLVVDGDIMVGEQKELEKMIREYEDHLANGGISTQGAMRSEGCTFWLLYCFGPYGYTWPIKNGDYIINYETIPNTFSSYERRKIVEAMIHIQSRTQRPGRRKIRFRLSNSGDRLRFVKDNNGTCSSYIGWQGGAQTVRLTSDCFNGINGYGTVVHELGHALGMIHEHQRLDRDAYVKVTGGDDSNILKRYPTSTKTTYDYTSIMHYFFIRNTLEPTSKWDRVNGPQRNALTTKDVEAIWQRYK